MNRNLRDGLNFFSKLNARRLLNAWLIFTSYVWSKWTRKPRVWGKPMVLEIEPTTSCNLRCPQCPSGLRQFSRPTGMLDMTLYRKIVDEAAEELVYLILYFQGEPFLHKQFLEMVRYASDKNIYVATSSNAHYFTDEMAKATIESGLDRLIISIDGTTQSSYEQYRIGGQLEKVIEGTKRLVHWKKQLNRSTPHIIWQFIAFRHNEAEIPEIKRMAREAGVDELGIKTAQIYDYHESDKLIPEDDKLSRYKRGENGFEIKNQLLNQCWRMWKGSVITWDGRVVPCCFDKDAQYVFGNVSNESLTHIWHNERYQSFRQSVLQSRKEIDICTNCTEGTKIWSS